MRLFYDNEFASIERETWDSIKTRLKTSSIKTLDVEKVTTNVILQHKIHIPVLGEDKDIKSLLYLEDANGKVYEPNPNAQYGNNRVVAVATFRIPFTGDLKFFDIKPSHHIEVGYQANIVANILI